MKILGWTGLQHFYKSYIVPIQEKLTNVVTKSMMSNQQTNNTGKVPTSALAYSMQQSITKLNNDLISGHTKLTEDIYGCVKYPNGYMEVFGTYPNKGLDRDSSRGGYSKTLDLSKYGFKGKVWSTAAPRYSGGFPKVSHEWYTTGKLMLISDVNVDGAFIAWKVCGSWK